ncbi:MAG: hypothetical protein E7F96_03875 [Veillonella sp.]|uniref:hypothetical protein n=1 Tax=Veillonella sp. TaxID=1926307 RepID=UPI002906AD1B|nr:hypothetical protein E7F96_03875 [Veillonella sp.]MDU3601428.1 hypothetical protein [Veillonella sp.]
MNNKQFTDELFKRMYDLGYRKAEIESGVLFFFNGKRELLNYFLPRVMVASTCFEGKDQLIDIAEYLGIVDWSKVAVDTPILVKQYEQDKWEKRHFAYFKDERVYAWLCGATSWSADYEGDTTDWNLAKLAEV